MKLSALIHKLQTIMQEHGDTENVALCQTHIAQICGREQAFRLEAFDEIEVLTDFANYPKGVTYLVADYPSRRHHADPLH